MRIVTLIENTPGSGGCLYEHGLSFYIETPRHRLLMDTGASGAALSNAEKLGIDLSAVDTLILSHGHYDHSGGILPFAKLNPNARIYMQRSAGGDYYHQKQDSCRYIGIDKAILELPQLILLDGSCRIDEELLLFTGITGQRFRPKANLNLMHRKDIRPGPDAAGQIPGQDELEQDPFEHEQCLVITAENKQILFSGCAHKGILNILDRYREIHHADPDLVLSGFHMAQKAEYTGEDILSIRQTAAELMQTDSMFYTGHCTGLPAYDIMKEIMGDRLGYFHSGDTITPDGL